MQALQQLQNDEDRDVRYFASLSPYAAGYTEVMVRSPLYIDIELGTTTFGESLMNWVRAVPFLKQRPSFVIYLGIGSGR